MKNLVWILLLASLAAAAKEEATPEQLNQAAKRMQCALQVCKKLERASQLTPPFIDINHCAGVKANEKPCKAQRNGQTAPAWSSVSRR